MLVVSLPPVHQETLLEEIISHPLVAAVRYNTGMDSADTPKDTLACILKHTARHGKPLYVDLKGRQLRIEEWAVLPFGPIVLNHKVKVVMPAKVFFRGDDACDLKKIVDGRKIYVDPLPKYPVGKGQSVNIIAEKVDIYGSLTDNDLAYIEAAISLGIAKFMLSFVESLDYIKEFEKAIAACNCKKSELILKIESQAGVDFIRNADKKLFKKYQLMAARDDLMIQIGGLNMMKALLDIIEKDATAICASRIFLGLEHGEINFADISDLRLMQSFGYKHFMFSDGVSRKHFKEAIKFWGEYIKAA